MPKPNKTVAPKASFYITDIFGARWCAHTGRFRFLGESSDEPTYYKTKAGALRATRGRNLRDIYTHVSQSA